MKHERQWVASMKHEVVYHAASRCQAAALSLTPRCLHGLKRTCSLEGKKIDGFASQNKEPLSSFDCVERPCRFKGRRNIGLVRAQHSEDNPHPYVRQGTDRDTMTFPFCTFALIVGGSPGLTQSTLPGKLMQGVTQWLDATQASVRFRVVAALKQDRRSASQSL
jgi:hypothetical protein